jgi:hypothetical protein
MWTRTIATTTASSFHQELHHQLPPVGADRLADAHFPGPVRIAGRGQVHEIDTSNQ